METKVVQNVEDLADCEAKLLPCMLLALDCEGVDLRRSGELAIVQVSSRTYCFLFDVLMLNKTSEVVVFLKKLLENSDIVKIVHDVKMDSDALYHCLGIKVSNVHDTQAWDKIIHGREDNLNETLSRNNCTPNVERNSSVYRLNNRFWAERPLTPMMIEWASGDVGCLFDLHDAQINQVAKCNNALKSKCIDASNERLALRDKIHQLYKIRGSKVGLFIGTGGQNIKNFCAEIPGTFYQINRKESRGYMCEVCIYAKDEVTMVKALQRVKMYA